MDPFVSGVDVVTPAAGAVVENQDISVAQAATISGTVTVPEGYTMDGITVYATLMDSAGMPTANVGATVGQDGTFTIANAFPGVTYMVYAAADPAASDLLTTVYGGHVMTDNPTSMASTVSDVIPVTLTPGEVKDDVQVAMVAPAYITGRVTLLNGDPVPAHDPGQSSYSYVYCLPVDDLNAPIYAPVRDNGTYSCRVVPGQAYVVRTNLPGYTDAWLGGYVGNDVSLPADDVTQVTAGSSGETLSGQDIQLMTGATISGTVTVPDSTRPLASWRLEACEVNSDGSVGDCASSYSAWSSMNSATGEYSFTGLLPDTDYYVYSSSNGYFQTWYGQWAGSSPNFSDPSVTVAKVHTNADGSAVTGVDIEMMPGAYITGTISGGWRNATVNVYACTATENGSGGVSLNNCDSLYLLADGAGEADYSLVVTPGRTLMISAQMWNGSGLQTLCGWVGGAVSPSCQSYFSGDDYTIVTAPAEGQTLADQDIALVKSGTISGKVTLPEGYSMSGYGNVYAIPVDPADSRYAVSTWVTSADGSYAITNAMPGVEYVVYATASGTTPDGLLTTGYGTWYGLYSPSNNPVPAGLTPVTVASGESATNVNITMVAPSYITGRVLLPDGTPATSGGVMCYPTTGFANGWSSDNTSATIAADGTYSCRVIPGNEYVVMAYLAGYPETWRGGAAGTVLALPATGVTPVTAGASGTTVSGQDITLVEPWSISGTLAYESAEGGYVGVEACAFDTNGNLLDCVGTSAVAADGSYTITGLIPGLNYSVDAWADGYVTTYYGGHVGYVGAKAAADVTPVTGTAGQTVKKIDITLVKAMTITGHVDPAVVAATGGVEVDVCPAFVGADGKGYYRTDAGYGMLSAPLASLSATVTPTTPESAAESYCQWAWIDPSGDGSYTVSGLVPGNDYVVVGMADGYETVWYGGYVGDAKLSQYDADGNTPDQLIPATGVTLVSGESGEVVPNVDLVFGQTATMYTVTFDPEGASSTPTVTTVPAGYTVGLPNYSWTGYTFAGWFTEKNGGGTEFKANTPVTADITVYAKWVAVSSSDAQVSFNANGGTGSMAAQTVTIGTAFTVPTPTFTKTCAAFAGWNTQADGTGTTYASGAKVTVTADLTLYALWTATPAAPGCSALPTYTVTYNANGGTGSIPAVTASAGPVTLAGAGAGITRACFTLTSWNTRADGSGTAYNPGSALLDLRNVTLYAQWAAADDAGCVPGTGTGTGTGGAGTPVGDSGSADAKAPTGGTVTGTGAPVVLSVLLLLLGAAALRARKVAR
jgi:uncharacterized repeat protein (TIGR02543 family)